MRNLGVLRGAGTLESRGEVIGRPVLRTRAQAELRPIQRIRDELASRVALVPFQPDEPVGTERLLRLVG